MDHAYYHYYCVAISVRDIRAYCVRETRVKHRRQLLFSRNSFSLFSFIFASKCNNNNKNAALQRYLILLLLLKEGNGKKSNGEKMTLQRRRQRRRFFIIFFFLKKIRQHNETERIHSRNGRTSRAAYPHGSALHLDVCERSSDVAWGAWGVELCKWCRYVPFIITRVVTVIVIGKRTN